MPGRFTIVIWSGFRFVNDVHSIGLNDAGTTPKPAGKVFITVFPELGAVSMAWFTYDAITTLMRLLLSVIRAAGYGSWSIVGNRAIADIEMTSGGLFDTVSAIARTDPPGSDGTMVLEFSSCNNGTVTC
jgi:hypothetical protein